MTIRCVDIAILLGTVLMIPGCTPAPDHARAVSPQSNDRVTLGTVQREIKVGMSGADVVAALGSPNMVTTDERRRETWVYDKISTETVYSSSSGGVGILFLGGVTGRSGAATTSQKTLTIIIHYDALSKVRDFAYRSSSF